MSTSDFGYNGIQGVLFPTEGDTTDITAGNQPIAPPDEGDKNDNPEPPKNNDGENGGSKPANQQDPPKDEPEPTGEDSLVEGTIVEIEDNKYTVDKDGNLVDSEGKIYKEAKDVKDFLAQYEQASDGEDELNIDNVLNKVGVQIVDDNDKPVVFDNTPSGIAAYIDAVVDKRREEYAMAGVNKLIETYPFVQDAINYYVANGNSLEGFGQTRDLSKITIDENNVAQQEAIVREAHRESGRRDNVDKYVQYLKDSGQLLDVAKESLSAMVAADEAERVRTAKEAAAKQKQWEDEQEKYWTGVANAIKNRKIAGYEIPETIILNKDGKKVAVTPDDFFNYLYQVDDKGMSRYVKDLSSLTPEQRRDDELLRAYLSFTGGSYADLVNMAIKEEKVKTLKLRAVNNTKRNMRITPPTNSKPAKTVDSNFGY